MFLQKRDTMRLANNSKTKLWALLIGGAMFVFTLCGVGQTNSSGQTSQQPSASGRVQGGVIPPLPDEQQPPNATKGAPPPVVQPSGTTPQPSSNQQPPAAQQPSQTQPATAQQAPANVPSAAPAPAQRPPNQPGTGQVPANAQEPSRQDNGVYVFKARVEEVVLHATVVDYRQRLVTNLD